MALFPAMVTLLVALNFNGQQYYLDTNGVALEVKIASDMAYGGPSLTGNPRKDKILL